MLLQLCPTLCNPTDGSSPGSPDPGILQARTLEWVAISFSNAWKWEVKVKSLSRVQLCDPMDCSPPGFPVHHRLPELDQSHVHRVGDAIQSSHPLSTIFPSTRVFSNDSVLWIRWPKYWSFTFSISPSDEYSGLISFRIDWFDLLAVQGTLQNLLHLLAKIKCSTPWRYT